MRLWVLLVLLVVRFAAVAQDFDTKHKKVRFQGYIKYLLTTNFMDGADVILTDNLIHHRLNFRYHSHKNLTFALDLRQRIHYGQLVQLTPNFAGFLDNDDVYDMSLVVVDRQSLVWHAMLDRAYVDYSKGDWQLTVGRQRINWGVTLVWNPNDIFNAYNFYDFDYEERQGSDAIRVQYYTGIASSIELAGKVVTDKDDIVAAALWKTNKGTYDIQVLGGVAQQDVVLGAGWAGSIRGAGFKGELNYFQPYQRFDTLGTFNGTISFDYSFKSSFYLNTGYLYGSAGELHPNVQNIALQSISAKKLSPYAHSFLIQVSYPITPLLNASLVNIYSPGDQALFLNPAITYSIKENWSIDILSQLFFTDNPLTNRYDLLGNSLFFRLKWSY